MLAVSTILLNVIDMPFTFFTVFDIVRNQYFFLDDALITAIPSAAQFIVSTFERIQVR